MYFEKKKINKIKTGKLIMESIISKNMTFDEVSILLELQSSRVIYDWIAGKKLPTLENLMNLSVILDKKVEDLIALR